MKNKVHNDNNNKTSAVHSLHNVSKLKPLLMMNDNVALSASHNNRRNRLSLFTVNILLAAQAPSKINMVNSIQNDQSTMVNNLSSIHRQRTSTDDI